MKESFEDGQMDCLITTKNDRAGGREREAKETTEKLRAHTVHTKRHKVTHFYVLYTYFTI